MPSYECTIPHCLIHGNIKQHLISLTSIKVFNKRIALMVWTMYSLITCDKINVLAGLPVEKRQEKSKKLIAK